MFSLECGIYRGSFGIGEKDLATWTVEPIAVRGGGSMRNWPTQESVCVCVFVGVLSLKQVGGRFFCSDIYQVQVTTSHIEKATMIKDSVTLSDQPGLILIAHPS